jgi:hypothetical protein
MVTVRAAPDGDGWSCVVSVEHAGVRRIHQVRVSPDDLARWGTGTERADVESLVARSFDFLLEREPPSTILASFDLSVIQRYFPEYDGTFRRREDR